MANEKSNENKKKYASLSTLSTFLGKLRDTFASLTHNHSFNDLEDKPFGEVELDNLNITITNPDDMVKTNILSANGQEIFLVKIDEYTANTTGQYISQVTEIRIDSMGIVLPVDDNIKHFQTNYEAVIQAEIPYIAVVKEDNATIQYWTFPETGVYVLAMRQGGTFFYVNGATFQSFIKTLDNKFISSDIARTVDVDAAIENINTSLSNKADKEHNHDGVYFTNDAATNLRNDVNESFNNVHSLLSDKAPLVHNHDDRYYTEAEIDEQINKTRTYASQVADNSANSIKNILLNGAGEAYDTLRELGELIDENHDAIDALEIVATNKADKDHNHDDVYYTETEVDEKLSLKADKDHNHDDKYDVKGSAQLVSDALDSHKQDSTVHISSEDRNEWDKAYNHSQSAHARVDATKVEGHATNGYIYIDGKQTMVYEHPKSNVVSGRYTQVEVNSEGHVIHGVNPETLAGLGITDAYTKNEVNTKLREAKLYTDTEVAKKAEKDHNHDSAYDAKGTAEEKADISLATAKSYTDEKVADLASTTVVDNKITTHNTSTDTHNDIRALITDLTTKLNNFLNVDDTTTDQLSEVLQLIEDNKGTLESLTTSKVNVSDIVDNLTTNSTSKVLSAAQGVAIKTLIDALQAELDSHTHTVSDITDLTVTATELNHLEGVTSNVQAQLDSKLSLDGGTLTGNLEISKANSPKLELATNTSNGYTSIYQHGGLLSISSGMTEDSDIGCIELKKPDSDLTTLARLRTKIGGVYHDYKLYGEHNKPTANDVSGLVGKSGTGTGAEIFNDYTNNTASGNYSHAEGRYANAKGGYSHAEGYRTNTLGSYSHAEGYGDNGFPSTVTSSTSNNDIITAWTDNKFSLAKGESSHVEGKNNLALNYYSHAEGYCTISSGSSSHTEGNTTKATGYCSHAEGYDTDATGYCSHAEGMTTTASGEESHAEGYNTTASGKYSHSEGGNTTASGSYSHAEGGSATAGGNYSHAEGQGTKASSANQHVQGKWNIEDTEDKYAHIVGNGDSTARSNAHTIDWDGNAWFQGNIYVGGESQDDTSASRVVTEADHEWTLIYDSGEIPNIANSISGIDVSGYTNFEILVRCYNDGDSHTTRTGSAIFTAENGKTYQFPVWTNMFTKSISTASVMAQFKLIDGWLICPCASKLTGDIDIFDTTEGGTAGNLTPIGSGMMKCTSPLSTLTISNLDQNSDYYFGMGSRVMVWGGKI